MTHAELISPTVPEVRKMILAMAGPEEEREFRLGWSLFRRAHQAVAKRCHEAIHRAKHASGHDARGRGASDLSRDTLIETAALTDGQWERVSPLLPAQKPPVGRPRRDRHQVLSGILWVMNTGSSWRDLPQEEFGPWQTIYSQYRRWCKEGLWARIAEALWPDELHEEV